MIFNTTYTNKDFTAACNQTVGQAFSLLKIIKMGGVGSSRFIVAAFSTKLQPKNKEQLALNYANIELRPNGIIVHFTNKQDRYSWVIPYYRLVTYNSQTFSIHANGSYIKFKKNKNYLANKKFIDKMIDLKNAFLNLSYYDA